MQDMTTRILAAGLVVALAACSPTSDRLSAIDDHAASVAGQPDSIASSRPAVAKRSEAFAMLPDRGDLIDYAPPAPHREGPSTWHRADVSEEHALRATVTGKLRMSAPGGEVLEYRYQRHVEHANGNWTWVGDLPGFPGRQAIITFGERAAFGLFGRPGAEPLQLTVRDGMAWIVESDPRAVRGVEAIGGQQDFLVPFAAVKQAAATKQAAVAEASATPTVDVALGYTAGFATSLGGQSQAVTRLTHLVAVTNQAYVSSHLNAQVRLVRTQQVSYPDNTSNDTALNELTGRTGSMSIPIPASLQPLRQARDLYGADLVSLVRKFSDPENDGCGIAWLIGGGGTSITSSDAPWGYSVVSDGSDGGFFCRTETLAHELGHNMGQNHNIEDTEGSSGVHAYSYGYREASATGFYTIMAYRSGDTQYPVSYFANPNVSADGRPTGVTNISDNVRSMVQTIPIVAIFRSTVVPLSRPRGDFDGDGKSDLLWRNGGTGSNVIWKAANSATPQAVSAVTNFAWKIVGLGDFNGDGKADILWRNESTGNNTIWASANSAIPQAVSPVGGTAWKVMGIGDFDGDGKSDILWRNGSTGANSIWRSANSATPQATGRVTDFAWKIVGVADFDGDGRSDILWRNDSTGANSIWRSANLATPQSVTAVGNLAWKVAGVGDFDGDGKSDILWRNGSTGANVVWKSASASTMAVSSVTNFQWKVVGVADFDGDGESDILWRNSSTGANHIWGSASSAIHQVLTPVADTRWIVQC
ncbi:MAG TPA: FG-GAP-like repeat-containing protein [Lysobacter sp.]|nr:FG-GAP-like repeat-containing protein [Lysobacter sp.]